MLESSGFFLKTITNFLWEIKIHAHVLPRRGLSTVCGNVHVITTTHVNVIALPRLALSPSSLPTVCLPVILLTFSLGLSYWSRSSFLTVVRSQHLPSIFTYIHLHTQTRLHLSFLLSETSPLMLLKHYCLSLSSACPSKSIPWPTFSRYDHERTQAVAALPPFETFYPPQFTLCSFYLFKCHLLRRSASKCIKVPRQAPR